MRLPRFLLLALATCAAPLTPVAVAAAQTSADTAHVRAQRIRTDSLRIFAKCKATSTSQYCRTAKVLDANEASNLASPRPIVHDTVRIVVHDTVASTPVPAPVPAPAGVARVQVSSPSGATSVAVGASLQLWGTPRDSAGKELTTATLAWSSSAPGVATVSAGLVRAIATGTTTITAAAGTVQGAIAITVTAATPVPVPTPTPTPTPGPATQTTVQLPLDSVDVTMPTTPRDVPVPAGWDLQAAFNAAQRGDRLLLDTGYTWRGNYTLPVKPGTAANGWILVTTRGAIPPPGTRVDSATAPHMARIMSVGYPPAIATARGADGWRLIGLEVTQDSAYTLQPTTAIILLGDGSSAQNALSLVASNLVLDRMFVHGFGSLQTKRCVALNSARTAIVESRLSHCTADGQDSQAIGGWNGPGPFLIANNYLAGAGENVMFGGADPFIAQLVPSDITIRGNHFTKEPSWVASYLVKNLLETKNARRVLVEGNVFENSFPDGQVGFAVLFKSSNQSGGCPWCGTSDVTFRRNLVRASAHGINLAAHPETFPVVPAARILVEGNLFLDIGAAGGMAVQLLGELADVTIARNTFVIATTGSTTHWIALDTSKAVAPATAAAHASNLVIDGNLATYNGGDPIKCCGATAGMISLARYATSYSYSVNAIIGAPTSGRANYPTSTLWAATLSDVFVAPGADWHAKAPYAALGADVDAVLAATRCAVTIC